MRLLSERIVRVKYSEREKLSISGLTRWTETVENTIDHTEKRQLKPLEALSEVCKLPTETLKLSYILQRMPEIIISG